MTPLAKGVALCLLSQILFAVLYLFSHWMRPINGTGVFALRMPAMAAGLWLMALYAVGARWRLLPYACGAAVGKRGCCF